MELQVVTAERMAKGQGRGMEPQAAGGRLSSATSLWHGFALIPIERVPQDRMADRRQVGPQLVGAAGVGLEF